VFNKPWGFNVLQVLMTFFCVFIINFQVFFKLLEVSIFYRSYDFF
jgi:hypothetical protein